MVTRGGFRVTRGGVEHLAGSGTQGVSVVGPLEPLVHCGTTDGQDFTPRVICSQGPGVRCEHLLVAYLPWGPVVEG
eukprot:1194255-Prorocentrum_minimum.AAC.2